MGAGFVKTLRGCAIALTVSAVIGSAARAQEPVEVLPTIDVTSSRLGGDVTGSSTSVITAQDIERSPAQSLPDVLGQATGVQVMHLSAGPTGVNDTVDLRGFGAFAQSNVLILVNGRRYQDFDLQGFDFSTIPLNSIARIEITRGNSGAVLYGDGAIGGVIDIVTKTAPASGSSGRVEGLAGSYGYEEGRVSAATASGPWSTSVNANVVRLSGYRQNSGLDQQNATANLKYTSPGWSGYFNLGLDNLRQGLPAGLPNLALVYPITLGTPRASVTPFDWGKKQDINFTTGISGDVAPGITLIADGGVRRKYQQSLFYNYFNNPGFVYDPSTAVPMNFVDTVMTTSSFTPRFDISHRLFGVPNRMLTGIDIYNTQYGSDRDQAQGLPPIHHYDITQTTGSIYAMNTTSVTPGFDLSFGGRLQRNLINGTDTYDKAVDPNAGFYASNPHARPVDRSEWQYAAHLGYEYRVAPALALFGRIAHAFRLPNADERVGAGNPFGVTNPATLNLKTQTSFDVEQGVRVKWQKFMFESTAYVMRLRDEIHFIPALFVDVNLDPTQRVGWENSASYELTNDVRVRGGVAYTNATFRDGPFAGKEVPLVSRWSGNAGVSWDIVQKQLVLDVTGRFFGQRRMDNDQGNVQPMIPATATMDVKIGGEIRNFFWSLTVQNLFNATFYDYAIASAFTPGYFTAYPQPGRTFLARAGATF